MMGNHSDTDLKLLVAQLKEGSKQAFECLYREHSKALLANIRYLVKDKEVASEILQDVYLKIWESRSSIDLDRSYKGFLYTVARNMIYDYLRKLALDERRRLVLISKTLEVYTHVEERLILKEHEKLLSEALSQLSLQCRKVYTLSKFEGKSHQEISQLLNISLATVNNHMVKSNRQIRTFFLQNSELSWFVALLATATEINI